ncbi:hypothetical protein RJT34_17430 [Clitoria ternatea]|uniref:RING-type E3 ubiquitin transferase n=1 Tax=Clitoria ternatea TaxID=43366 RepID=A0AAN9JAK3_CLITE
MGATSASNDSPVPVEITGKIMVVAIIFLFIVVVFVLLLHLYAKWFWWTMEENTAPPPPRNRRRRRRRFVFAPGQDPVFYSSSHQAGLDPSVLKSLPVLVFQPENFKDGLECAVCLSEIVEGEKARLLPKCSHGFHVDCIDMWFHSHSTCPLCRNPVSPESSCNTPSGNSNVGGNVNESPIEENDSGAVSGLESSNFPTNVLVWGDHTQVSSVGVPFEEGATSSTTSQQQPPCSSSSSSSDSVNSSRCHGNGMLMIDIPSEFNSSTLSPSGSRCGEDEVKSPMAATLRSFKKLLSRDNKKLSPSCSPSSVDVEQGHG